MSITILIPSSRHSLCLSRKTHVASRDRLGLLHTTHSGPVIFGLHLLVCLLADRLVGSVVVLTASLLRITRIEAVMAS
jgi:hypothetical protein